MKNLITTEWRLLLFGFLMTFWSAPGQTFFISLFGGVIRDELQLSHTLFGGIYSLATLASAALLVVTGPLVDKVDLKKFSFVLILVLALGCISLSFSNSVISLLVSIFLVRHVGQGLMTLTAVTTMLRYLEQNKGKANALAGMGYSTVEAIMPSIIIILLAKVGWRGSWQLTAAVLLFVMPLAIAWLLKTHQSRHHTNITHLASNNASQNKRLQIRHWTRKQVLRDKRFYLFLPAILTQTLLFTGFIFHQIYLVETKGWDLTLWGSLFVLYAIVSTCCTFLVGIWIDRRRALPLLPIMALPVGFAMLLLSISSSTITAILFMLLMAMTAGIVAGATGPFWAELYGIRYLGSIKSITTALMVFSSALSPVLLGLFIDRGVSIEQLAFGGFLYAMCASLLAAFAYRSSSAQLASG